MKTIFSFKVGRTGETVTDANPMAWLPFSIAEAALSGTAAARVNCAKPGRTFWIG